MYRLRALIPLVALFVLLAPQVVFAQGSVPLLDPEWHIVPDPSKLDSSCKPTDPLGIGGVIVLLQNLMNAAVALGVIVMTIVIAYSGFLLLTSPFNSENRSKAKTTLGGTMMGIFIVLSAWLVMDFVMKILYNPDAIFAGQSIGPWNQVLVGGDACIKASDKVKPLFDFLSIGQRPQPDYTVGAGGGGTPVSRPAGGSCRVASSGACSVQSLSKTCFAGRAEEASRICNLESAGGNPAIKSGSDRLNGGSGPSYSVGLWQINLTVHKVGGLDCPSAFTMTCGAGNGSLVGPNKPGACRSQIKPGMERLYEQCVSAAQNAAQNTEVACRLYGSSATFQPWSYSANKCSVPKR